VERTFAHTLGFSHDPQMAATSVATDGRATWAEKRTRQGIEAAVSVSARSCVLALPGSALKGGLSLRMLDEVWDCRGC